MMRTNTSGKRALAALASVAALVLAACGNGTVTPAPTAASSARPSASPMAAQTATSVRTRCIVPTPGPRPRSGVIDTGAPPHVEVRWFVGLGPGENPAQITLQQHVTNDFDALQDKRTDGVEPILLSLEILQSSVAADMLKGEIASCNAPDLIGPETSDALHDYAADLLDLRPLLTGKVDFSAYPLDQLVACTDPKTGALFCLPYPSGAAGSTPTGQAALTFAISRTASAPDRAMEGMLYVMSLEDLQAAYLTAP